MMNSAQLSDLSKMSHAEKDALIISLRSQQAGGWPLVEQSVGVEKYPPLTDFDLRQIDDDSLRKLSPWPLLRMATRLLATLKIARDRLNQTPENSSKPPSSRPAWEIVPDHAASVPAVNDDAPSSELDTEKEKKASPAPQDGIGGAAGKKQKNKKAGKQLGAKGVGRTQKLTPTEIKLHYPCNCAACSAALPTEDVKAYTGWYEVDIAELAAGEVGVNLAVIEHRLHESVCACGHITRAAHYKAEPDPMWKDVDLGQWRLIGPRLAGFIVFLVLRMRLSRARIREFLIELLGLHLSVGAIDEAFREAGRCAAPLEDEMVNNINDAKLLGGDETPWKEAGLPLWLWVFVSQYTRLFFIGYRSMEILNNTLTDKFQGNFMSDGYLTYRHLKKRLRCWANLIRKLQGLVDSTDTRVAAAGKEMLNILCLLMEAIYLARLDKTQKNGSLAGRYAIEIARLRTLCEEHQNDTYEKLGAVAREFLNDWETILRQVYEPDLPLTNNAAEQALRHWVIARRICQGTRSEAGTRAYALLASVVETCRVRGASSWKYMATVIAAARLGAAVPMLPPIPVGG
jgi:transposase